MNLYLDESGTRNPDHENPAAAKVARDWFGFGGILIDDEDEPRAREMHKRFCDNWGISDPLHSAEIRHHERGFAWLAVEPEVDQHRFFRELGELLTTLPVVGVAAIIDRPGYNTRYREKYGKNRWMLCKTAFEIVVERAAKYAISKERRIRVLPEKADKTADKMVEGYYWTLKERGLSFSKDTSAKYGPLTQAELTHTLYDLKFKSKSSPMAQIADIYLYPMCLGGYKANYAPLQAMARAGKLIDCQLAPEMVEALGIKYSCFEGVRAAQNKKAGISPGL